MNILLTGIDGYIGWPTALKLSKEFPESCIIGVDNLKRRQWVQESGSISALPIYSMEDRIDIAERHGFENIRFILGDLTDRDFVKRLYEIYKFNVVLHLAAQPSAPYSQIDGERAAFTQYNNNQATLNLLWAIKEVGIEKDCHFIETTTTGVYGAPGFKIPEGFILAENNGNSDVIPFSGMAGSWYHMSKSNDINNLWLANKQWNLSITDLRTAIVYGIETEETNLDSRLATRFDFDFYFGVVMNRFCAMAISGFPITIYGKGGQKKPQISLEDCVQSNVNAVKLKFGGEFKVFNQVSEVIRIVDLAETIVECANELQLTAEIKYIPNPRIENESHNMGIETENFSTILPVPKNNLSDGAHQIIQLLTPYHDTFKRYKDRFIKKKS